MLSKFSYPEVIYVGATADRITPRPEDFRPRRLGTASHEIRDVANRIFSTLKFDGLKVINLKPGSGNQAFLLQATPPPGAAYFSERNFSLGELCVVKLLRRLKDCPRGAMVLIDELELALHPKAQVELLNHLKLFAPTKDLTIIFSTHSVSLLKSTPRNDVIFLEELDGQTTAIKGCFPAYALGNIAYSEERAPDCVIYVEDDAAVQAMEGLLPLIIAEKFGHDMALRPTVQVLAIGLFMSVVRHLAGSDAVLPQSTRAYALLDEDVKSENVATWTASGNLPLLAEFGRHQGRIQYLPWTPEVGLAAFLREPGGIAELAFRRHFGNNIISVRANDIGPIAAPPGGAQRRDCKRAVSAVADHFRSLLPTLSAAEIRRRMFNVFVTHYFAQHRQAVMQSLGPLLP